MPIGTSCVTSLVSAVAALLQSVGTGPVVFKMHHISSLVSAVAALLQRCCLQDAPNLNKCRGLLVFPLVSGVAALLQRCCLQDAPNLNKCRGFLVFQKTP